MKQLDMTQSVHDLIQATPELTDILRSLGFAAITSKAMFETAARMVTLEQAAAMKHIDMNRVVRTLKDHGFEPIGLSEPDDAPASSAGDDGSPAAQPAASRIGTDPAAGTRSERIERLKSYLTRLKSGDELASVQADFVQHFHSVDAGEIIQAEQELMAQGTPLQEVQRLCDVHSALFHGSTREEKIARAEEAVRDSITHHAPDETLLSRKEQAARLEDIDGHPLQTFTRENHALAGLIREYEQTRDQALLPRIRDVVVHYAKKGDLLYPLLNVTYGISGPSDVMWTVDDEIRDALAKLDKVQLADRDQTWQQQTDAVLQRAKEMIYKEQNILFPITAQHFTEEEWMQIYQDTRQYPDLFELEHKTWDKGEAFTREPVSVLSEGLVRMPGGTLKLEELTALLDTLPLEITFVDANDINRYFNDGPGMKVFKRPLAALGREVYTCHPPKIEPMVRHIIAQFRDGTRDEVAVWMEKAGRPMYVRYMAVRSKTGKFLGTLEAVQDMTFAKEHFEQSR